jgi:hypothetical protein
MVLELRLGYEESKTFVVKPLAGLLHIIRWFFACCTSTQRRLDSGVHHVPLSGFVDRAHEGTVILSVTGNRTPSSGLLHHVATEIVFRSHTTIWIHRASRDRNTESLICHASDGSRSLLPLRIGAAATVGNSDSVTDSSVVAAERRWR